jgi:HAD superfamily hydrolase (TIGR01549 family)
MSYEAVVFDNDGVLTVPTGSEVYRAAVRTAFEEFGVDPTTEGVDGIVHGSLTRIQRVCNVHGVDHEEFWPRHEAHAAAAQREALERGIKTRYEDFDALRSLDVPLAVVSNNQQATVDHVVEVFDLDDLFEVTYGREPTIEGVRRKKPSSHYVERALEALDVESALYVGDSNVDVLAADRAGIDSAFVHRPHRADYQLAADPTHELDSLHDLPALC